VSVISHVRAGLVPALRLLPAVLAAAACFALSACSPGADYPTIFPAIHDMPPPRAETPLDADQVQQATEDLIAERNRMNGGPQGSGQARTTAGPAANSANPQPKKQPPVQPAVQTTAITNAGGAPADSAETK
jgi:hypothetical protein